MRDALRVVPRQGDVPPIIPLEGGHGFRHPLTALQYRLNPTALVMWEAVRVPTTVGALRQTLRQTFDVGLDEATRATDDFLGWLSELGLIDLRDEDPVPEHRDRYLRLLARAVLNLIYPEHELRLAYLERNGEGASSLETQRRLRDIRYDDPDTFARLLHVKRTGAPWGDKPHRDAHSMVGEARLNHLAWCAAQVFAHGVRGDFLEAGVCQGGASIFMRGLQVAYGEAHRLMWVADSFEGLPPSAHDADRGRDWTEPQQPWLAIRLEAVQDHFRAYDLLSPQVRFLRGWFKDTLPSAPIESLAMLRIDADLYASTRAVLDALYDKVSPGGFVIVDEYHIFPPCRAAVDDFRLARAIAEPLRRVDWAACYWRVPAPP